MCLPTRRVAHRRVGRIHRSRRRGLARSGAKVAIVRELNHGCRSLAFSRVVPGFSWLAVHIVRWQDVVARFRAREVSVPVRGRRSGRGRLRSGGRRTECSLCAGHGDLVVVVLWGSRLEAQGAQTLAFACRRRRDFVRSQRGRASARRLIGRRVARRQGQLYIC